MPSDALRPEGRDPRVPSMLDLVRLSPRPLFPPGGVDLYRQIALLTGMGEGDEVLDVACGRGVSLEYFVREFGVQGSGVDPDTRLVEEAEARAREGGLSDSLQYQAAPSHRLPYRDEIFDVSVGEIGLAADGDPSAAVSELVRVTRPGGYVVLVQLVWKAAVDEGRQRILAEHLGARPLLLVEWKRRLRTAGIEELRTEDWSDTETAFRAREVKPFPDFAEIFSLTEKIGILRRAWRRWGWSGVRAVLAREREIHRLLNRERILGLDLLTGRKPAEAGTPASNGEGEAAAGDGPGAASGTSTPPAGRDGRGTEGGRPDADGVREADARAREGGPAQDEGAAEDEGAADGDDPETAGLPLFGEERGEP